MAFFGQVEFDWQRGQAEGQELVDVDDDGGQALVEVIGVGWGQV